MLCSFSCAKARFKWYPCAGHIEAEPAGEVEEEHVLEEQVAEAQPAQPTIEGNKEEKAHFDLDTFKLQIINYNAFRITL